MSKYLWLLTFLFVPTVSFAKIALESETAPRSVKALEKVLKLNAQCELEEETIYDSDGYHPIGTQLIDVCRWQDVTDYLASAFPGKEILVQALNSKTQDLKESGSFRGEHELHLIVKVTYLP